MAATCQDCAITYEVWPAGGCPNCRSLTWRDQAASSSSIITGDLGGPARLGADVAPADGETVADPDRGSSGSATAPRKASKRAVRRKADTS